MDTFGWDCIWAADFDRVNQLIGAGYIRLPKIFTQQPDYSVMIEQLDWKLTASADGRQLCLLTDPIIEGSIWIGKNAIPKTLQGVRLKVWVTLSLTKEDGGNRQLTIVGQGANASGSSPIAVNVEADSSCQLSEAEKGLLAQGAEISLSEKHEELDYIGVEYLIGTINPLSTLINTTSDWNSVGFHHFQTTNRMQQTRNVLAIYMAATAKGAGGMNLDPGLLGENGSAGFAVSPAFFLDAFIRHPLAAAIGCRDADLMFHHLGEEMVIPGYGGLKRPDGSIVYPVLYPRGENPEGFHQDDVISESMFGLYLPNPVNLAKIRVGLVDYVPILTWLFATISGDTLSITFRGKCDMGLNIWGYWERNIIYKAKVDPKTCKVSLTIYDDNLSFNPYYKISGQWSPIDTAVRLLIDAAISDVTARLKAQLRINLSSVNLNLTSTVITLAPKDQSAAQAYSYSDGGVEDGVWFRETKGN